MWALGAQPRKECVGFAAGAAFLLRCHAEWSVTGQERGWRSKAKLRAACPCRELCPPVLVHGGGRSAPWQQPGPFLGVPSGGLRPWRCPACSPRTVAAALGTGCLPTHPASGGLPGPHLGVHTWGLTLPAPGAPPGPHLGAHAVLIRCQAGMGCILNRPWGPPRRQPPQPPQQDHRVIGAYPALA